MIQLLPVGRAFVMEFQWVTGGSLLEEIRQLFLEYADSLGFNLDFQGFKSELQSLPGKYAPPEGALVLALLNGKSAGCVALRRLAEDTCEMKRLYVCDTCRGYGLGRQLAVMIMDEARRLGYARIRLDTLTTMLEANQLYESLGFYDIEPYIYNPMPGARFMELRLG
jgi:ribosomal protein S18 acetylase RimI-like enzyme